MLFSNPFVCRQNGCFSNKPSVENSLHSFVNENETNLYSGFSCYITKVFASIVTQTDEHLSKQAIVIVSCLFCGDSCR